MLANGIPTLPFISQCKPIYICTHQRKIQETKEKTKQKRKPWEISHIDHTKGINPVKERKRKKGKKPHISSKMIKRRENISHPNTSFPTVDERSIRSSTKKPPKEIAKEREKKMP